MHCGTLLIFQAHQRFRMHKLFLWNKRVLSRLSWISFVGYLTFSKLKQKNQTTPPNTQTLEHVYSYSR